MMELKIPAPVTFYVGIELHGHCLGSVPVSYASAPEPVFARGKARGAMFGVPNKRRETPHRAKTGPARRVARQMSPCGVAELGKGVTIACVPRLAWRHCRSNAECDETGTDPKYGAVFRQTWSCGQAMQR